MIISYKRSKLNLIFLIISITIKIAINDCKPKKDPTKKDGLDKREIPNLQWVRVDKPKPVKISIDLGIHGDRVELPKINISIPSKPKLIFDQTGLDEGSSKTKKKIMKNSKAFGLLTDQLEKLRIGEMQQISKEEEPSEIISESHLVAKPAFKDKRDDRKPVDSSRSPQFLRDYWSKSIDIGANPCSDFYQFACGKSTRSLLDEQADRNTNKIRQLIVDERKYPTVKQSNMHNIRRYYKSCLEKGRYMFLR